MKPEEMDHLIETHLEAEKAGDTAKAVSMYTEDATSTPRRWSLPTATMARTSA
jgi:ketosteroid isomerase-like protein